MSAVVLAMATIATAWEAVTPPDRTSITYHQVETRASLDGTAGDRGFAWELPVRSGPAALADGTQVAWDVTAILRLDRAGRGVLDMAQAVANESQAIMAAAEAITSWPAGVVEVVTLPTAPRRLDKGDVEVVLRFNILTAET